MKEVADNRITKQWNFLHRENYYGFQLNGNQRVEDFKKRMLKKLAIMFFLVLISYVFQRIWKLLKSEISDTQNENSKNSSLYKIRWI